MEESASPKVIDPGRIASKTEGFQLDQTMTATFGIRGATHDFAGVRALHDVDFEIRAGGVHGLVGQNGSGKSTLVKILTGALQPRAGELFLDDRTTSLATPAAAQRVGIGVVHQDYNLFPELTVAANVYGIAKAPPRHRWIKTVDKRELARQVEMLFDQLRIKLSPSVLVRHLSAAERKFVEIGRAMLLHPKFLILDEPTASLAPDESRKVLELLARLREQGVGLVFVSHRLDEVLSISDRVTVLRDGYRMETARRDELTQHGLAELIIGKAREAQGRQGKAREAQGRHDGARSAPPEVIIRIRNLRLGPHVPPIGFEVHRGEIFGLTGLLGSGAADVVHMLGGARPFPGELQINTRSVAIHDPRDAQQAGIGFIPEDRKAVGLVQDQSVAINVSLSSLRKVSSLGWISRTRLNSVAKAYQSRLDIRTPSVGTPVKALSGGNQQKVMLAKWLASGVRVLAIEEPTHGIDIGGKVQVHALLREFAAQGGSIVVASTDVEEILDLCARVGIMRHGRLAEVLRPQDVTRADLAAGGLSGDVGLLEALGEISVSESDDG